jgi:PAS domain S-box-containing protein
VHLQTTIVTGDGRRIPVEIHASYIKFGGVERLIAFLHDVTDRMIADEALVESEEKFRVLAEMSPSAIFMYQGEKLIYANPAAVRLTGYSVEEIRQKNFWDMVHPKYRDMVKSYGLARLRSEPVPVRYDVKYITKKGEERWAEFNAGLIEYLGKPAGIVTAYDMTDRKNTEIALRDAKAQAELYLDLMGHDINNMNQAALGFLEIVGEKLATRKAMDVDDLKLINNAMDSLRRSSGLIASVRKLQKESKGGLKPEVMDLGKILAEVKGQYSIVPEREVIISYVPSCKCFVLANELLKDVFSNIVGNAIKHSQGAIAINISLQTADENNRLFCKVIIKNTGPGIPDEHKR